MGKLACRGANVIEAGHVRQAGGFCRRHHPAAIFGVAGKRLFAKDSLAVFKGGNGDIHVGRLG